MNFELRRSLARVQTVLCEASTSLEALAGDTLSIQVTTAEDVTAVQVLEQLGCRIEFEPTDQEAFNGGPNGDSAWMLGTALVTVPSK